MDSKSYFILGANGQLGRQFRKELSKRDAICFAPDEKECNITDGARIEQLIEKFSPTTVINCAAYNAVDDAEEKSELAYRINATAVRNIAGICKPRGVFFVHYGTDYVFDGQKENFYCEDDAPNPLGVYGKSKLAGEDAVRQTLDDFLVLRLSWVFGDGTQNFIHKLLGWASQNKVLRLSSDEVSVPTSTHDIVNVTLLALEAGLRGTYHLTNSGYCSRYEWGRFVLESLGKDNLVIPVPMSSFRTAVQRPAFTPMSNALLSSKLGIAIPDWKEAVRRYLNNRETTNA